MKFTFPNKGEFEANIITDILNSEKIFYKTKLLSYNNASIKLYDIITSDISYEHYLFVKTLADKKIEPYITALKSFELPSFDKDKKVQPVPVSINATISVSENTPILEVHELFKQLDKDLTNAFISIQAKREKKENKVKSFFKNILKGICE